MTATGRALQGSNNTLSQAMIGLGPRNEKPQNRLIRLDFQALAGCGVRFTQPANA
jgi:hypothetical protein